MKRTKRRGCKRRHTRRRKRTVGGFWPFGKKENEYRNAITANDDDINLIQSTQRRYDILDPFHIEDVIELYENECKGIGNGNESKCKYLQEYIKSRLQADPMNLERQYLLYKFQNCPNTPSEECLETKEQVNKLLRAKSFNIANKDAFDKSKDRQKSAELLNLKSTYCSNTPPDFPDACRAIQSRYDVYSGKYY